MKNTIHYIISFLQLALILIMVIVYINNYTLIDIKISFAGIASFILALIASILMFSGKHGKIGIKLSLINCVALLLLLLIIIANSIDPGKLLNTQNGLSQIIASTVTGAGALSAATIGYHVVRINENDKRDREIIHSLNERYTNIISNLNKKSDGGAGDNISINNSFYFLALVSLYKDWDALGNISPLVNAQKDVQQKFILKTIFNAELSKSEGKYAKSAIDEIFSDDREKDSRDLDTTNIFFSSLEIRGKDFSCLDFQGSTIKNVKFINCTFKNTKFENAEILDCVEFEDCTLKGVHLQDNFLQLIFKKSTLDSCKLVAGQDCKTNQFIDTTFEGKNSFIIQSSRKHESKSRSAIKTPDTINTGLQRKSHITEKDIFEEDYFKFVPSGENNPKVEVK